ncbi:type IV pilus biogenesis/stability protein PilW [Legionella worsleiensis]|uniref:Fimbrial biogenesis and twitching motility protein PilF n=1 Tax=Legionella worsleiensis TaxID=45076 RepID=A0A0W1AJL4_9GAMM|nr:type IV pilus biogenesis/stability protein PilW [Legionella worsleiensis]KTD81400.1 fimbrial biogenesis and twitching motility protein PilF [Legionella worsleiensis]STY30057.1 type IV pilus assembly protein PilF [Legionella worsleiensis]
MVLRYLLICMFLFLQGCNHTDQHAEPELKKTDLTKAASYNTQLGLGYLKQGDRPRAKKKLLTAIKQEPNSSEVNAAMAYYFEQTNELDEARKHYLKAISLSSGGGAQLNNYGAFLCRQGDYKKAEIYFLKAVKDVHYINTAAAYENAGLCALAIPDKKKAKEYFINALDQDPSRKQSLFELVKLENNTGHLDEAYTLLQNHPDLVLNDKYFLTLAKDIAVKTGHFAVAAAYERNLRTMEPTTDNSGANDEYNSHSG